ncbi:hypothetical protein [Massilia sp. CF038]|uniref:hypothetical protein n=1 Tax=Massilia sp. CF038 TaxID=1881045 RepID=UPI00091DEEEA|nr:hypothetical protein [Massilia sp. CF038]SHH19649.1 hypothetical protein SAMN05428948_3263 [Massilia sp. CF038]
MTQNEQKANPTIPTHPADPAVKGEQAKVVGKPGAVHDKDYNDPPPQGAAKSTGKALDEVGGAGLGKPPGQ